MFGMGITPQLQVYNHIPPKAGPTEMPKIPRQSVLQRTPGVASISSPPNMPQPASRMAQPIIARMVIPGTSKMNMPGPSGVQPSPITAARPMLSESYGVPAKSQAFAMPGPSAPPAMQPMRVMPGMNSELNLIY